MRRGDQLDDLVPRGADEAAAAALRLVEARLLFVLDDRGPGLDGIAESGACVPEHLEQAAAHVRVLHPQRRVRVPGKRRAAGAATRLVFRHLRPRRRVVDCLRLPGDQPVLDVHVPAAGAGAVDAVGGADDLVVLPALPVERLPLAALADELAPPFRVRLAATEELVRLQDRRSLPHLPECYGPRSSPDAVSGLPRSSCGGAVRSSQTASSRQPITNTSSPTKP